jgi:hypothetical protein
MPGTDAYEHDGYVHARGLIPQPVVGAAREAIVNTARALVPGIDVADGDVDAAWQQVVHSDRGRAGGGLIYNAAKLLPEIHALADVPELLAALKSDLGFQIPAIVDVNFRIDAPEEQQYLFPWHQDYWFSICSPRAVVAWAPLTDLDDETGGVDVIERHRTGGRVLRARGADDYLSYSGSVVLDEEVDTSNPVSPQMNAGDVLFFGFDVLHRSRPNVSRDRCRWTLQARFADLADPEFQKENFKPGVVTKDKITYLERLNGEAANAV